MDGAQERPGITMALCKLKIQKLCHRGGFRLGNPGLGKPDATQLF